MFATTVFFVPYYVELGYSNSRIGIIMAANSAMASVFPPLLGCFRISCGPSAKRCSSAWPCWG